jgi:MFS-type transporter involved in bile tolerance (Atg22 family)
MTQITEAYNNSSSIPIDELSFTFGIPLTLQLEQNTNIMEAWLFQFQAGQKRLANKLKQERRNQGEITKFLISRTRGCCPEKPPD